MNSLFFFLLVLFSALPVDSQVNVDRLRAISIQQSINNVWTNITVWNIEVNNRDYVILPVNQTSNFRVFVPANSNLLLQFSPPTFFAPGTFLINNETTTKPVITGGCSNQHQTVTFSLKNIANETTAYFYQIVGEILLDNCTKPCSGFTTCDSCATQSHCGYQDQAYPNGTFSASCVWVAKQLPRGLTVPLAASWTLYPQTCVNYAWIIGPYGSCDNGTKSRTVQCTNGIYNLTSAIPCLSHGLSVIDSQKDCAETLSTSSLAIIVVVVTVSGAIVALLLCICLFFYRRYRARIALTPIQV